MLTWTGVRGVISGGFNDEGLHVHPLYAVGLDRVTWAGNVEDSHWIAQLQSAAAQAEPLRHYVLPLKEGVVEVAAAAVTVTRTELAPRIAARLPETTH